MQNHKLLKKGAMPNELKSTLSGYASILADCLKENIGFAKKKVFYSVSPCGRYVVLGLFDAGLEPEDGEDIWNSRPAAMPGATFAVVGGSDIFVCKNNERGKWTKFAAQRDSIAISQLVCEQMWEY